MAEDELVLNIEKAFWPKGVMRGLTTVLRTLGDKHGNLVIVAQPLKGTIMVKGPADKIEEVKPELREVIEEHFPDADVPEELLAPGCAGDTEAAEAAEGAPEPEAAPAPEAPPAKPTPPAPPAPHKPSAEPAVRGRPAAVLAPAAPVKLVVGRKRTRASMMASSDLLWECIQGSSSFIRKPTKELQQRFSAEPTNLMGLHYPKYCGLVSKEALDIRPAKRGPKEAIQLVQSQSKAGRRFRPGSMTTTMGLSKCPKRALLQLDRELAAKFYRQDLHSLARTKYLKVQQSFKTKRRVMKPRRTQK